jgi:hypothetical protein
MACPLSKVIRRQTGVPSPSTKLKSMVWPLALTLHVVNSLRSIFTRHSIGRNHWHGSAAFVSSRVLAEKAFRYISLNITLTRPRPATLLRADASQTHRFSGPLIPRLHFLIEFINNATARPSDCMVGMPCPVAGTGGSAINRPAAASYLYRLRSALDCNPRH